MASTRDLHIPGDRVLPARLLTARAVRSSGPGGQNVNKVATKVDLRLDLAGVAELHGDWLANRIRRALLTRLDAAGDLRVVCDAHRERPRNLEQAHARLEAMITRALAPKKHRVKTKPSRAAKQRRLDGKKRRGELKRRRSQKRFD